MTQPSRIPVIATETDPYDAPGEAWDGAARITEMDAAVVADGFEPDAPMNAQDANWLLNNIGKHLASLAPMAVDNWSPQRSQAGTFRAHSNRGRMFSIGTTRLGWEVGAVASGFYSSDLNYNVWTDPAVSPGFTNVSPAAYGAGVVVVISTDDGTARQTSNLGATWSGAGTLSASGCVGVHYFEAVPMWLAPGATGGDNYIAYDADLSGSWVTQPVPAGVLADTITLIDIVSNGSECLAAYSNGHIIRSTNGTSWVDAGDVSGGTSWVGLAWSESHGLWAAVATDGEIYFSPTGAVWSAGPTGIAGAAGDRVAALGRYWVYPTSGYIARFDQDEVVQIGETLVGASQGVRSIHRHGDQLVISFVDSSSDLNYKFSLRLTGG
jgi:hypothetical protein